MTGCLTLPENIYLSEFDDLVDHCEESDSPILLADCVEVLSGLDLYQVGVRHSEFGVQTLHAGLHIPEHDFAVESDGEEDSDRLTVLRVDQFEDPDIVH